MIDSPSILKEYTPAHHKTEYKREVWQLICKRALNPPQKQGIAFVGSSIFRLWRTLKADMKPLPVLNQAFGGSRTWEVLHYADQLIIPHQPRIIVYYCGSNDIDAGENAAGIRQRFQIFVEYIKTHLPETIIFFVSINRAPQKRDKLHIVDAANNSIKKYCQATANLEFIDINFTLVDQNRQIDEDLFLNDRLHFKPFVYQKLTKVIQPILEDTWNKIVS